MNLTYVAEEFEFRDRTLVLTLDVEFTCSPYDPGVTYGPPESCYPPEGGDVEDLDVTLVRAGDDEGRPIDEPAFLAALRVELARRIDDDVGAFRSLIEERCREEFFDAEAEPYEPEFDYAEGDQW